MERESWLEKSLQSYHNAKSSAGISYYVPTTKLVKEIQKHIEIINEREG